MSDLLIILIKSSALDIFAMVPTPFVINTPINISPAKYPAAYAIDFASPLSILSLKLSSSYSITFFKSSNDKSLMLLIKFPISFRCANSKLSLTES